MPRTRLEASPQLEILLDGGRNSYDIGSTLSGRVVRNAPIVASRAWLTVQLIGRTKSKMVVSRGQAGTSIYRGRFSLFSPTDTQVQLFDGPMHIAADGEAQEWRFSIPVPRRPDAAAVATGNDQKFSYLPLGQRDIESQPLPPVFFTTGFFFTTTYECFVEYFVEAKLHIESAGASEKVDRATVPIAVVNPSVGDPTAEAELARRSFLCRIRSYRFTQQDSGSLSVQQRTRAFFSSSKVPQFAFSLQVEHPTAFRIDDMSPIPFKLQVFPDNVQTTEEIRNKAYPVTLTSMTFEIKSCMNLICRGTLSPHTSDQTLKFGVDAKSAIDQLSEPIVLPSGVKAEPLDVGALLNLSLGQAHQVSHKPFSRRKRQLYLSFSTFNIKYTHKLKWSVTVSTIGESTEVSNEVGVVLLPGQDSELPPYVECLEPPSPVDKKELRCDA
ncbi:hypothetical protein jhhlp_008162 [Lomentospora prolificans]|uniref:Arrestin-like N-terminal domain-containing protein n=1 Tax=Lomentospora prolificans TaxID=41688 RepID=A0A2N3MZN0_9PEZI|nr:hypothetical protein jhhlp_008162 [Lomentospora prolificans]